MIALLSQSPLGWDSFLTAVLITVPISLLIGLIAYFLAKSQIKLTKTFKKGDKILLNGEEGEILEIGDGMNEGRVIIKLNTSIMRLSKNRNN